MSLLPNVLTIPHRIARVRRQTGFGNTVFSLNVVTVMWIIF